MLNSTLIGPKRIRTVTVIPETPDGLAEAWSYDVVTESTETNGGQAFRHPLQNGQEGITDGTRLEPPEFSVGGITTDTPVRSLIPVGDEHPGAVALYEQIKAIRARQIPVMVMTSWAGTLLSRWPEVITGSHGAADGGSIQISINFVRFRLVFSQLTPQQVDSDVALLGSQTVQQTQFAG
jgi:hypothetical protein